MTGEFKFSEVHFGYKSEEDFIREVDKRIEARRQEISSGSEGLDLKDERIRIIWERQFGVAEKSLAELEKHRQDPSAFYCQVRGIYDRVVALEGMGLSEGEIAKRLLDDGMGDRILPISDLLENDSCSKWGYPLVGALLGVKTERFRTGT